MGQHAEEWRTLHNFLAKYGSLFEGAREIAAKADALDDACTAHANELAVLEEQIAAAKATLAGLDVDGRVAAAEAHVAAYRTKRQDAVDAEVATLRANLLAAYDADAAKLHDEIAELARQRDGLSETVNALSETRHDVTEEVAAKQKLLASVEKRLASVRDFVGGSNG